MNGRSHSLFKIINLLFVCLLMACREESLVPALTPTVDPVVAMQAALQATSAAAQGERNEQLTRWLEELDTAESRWEAAGVSHYAITVFYVNSPQGIIQYHHVTVKDGEIIAEDAACSEQAPQCIIKKIDLQNVTVPGLLGMARNTIINDEIVDNGTEFNFDPIYGVPEWIALKTSGQFPWYWHVESFEVLE